MNVFIILSILIIVIGVLLLVATPTVLFQLNWKEKTRKEKILFLFNFSLKKRKPKKTLIIGKIKYPKLASIILFVATAYIHIDQFPNIKILVINKINNFFLSKIIFFNKYHLLKNVVVIKSIKLVQIHL